LLPSENLMLTFKSIFGDLFKRKDFKLAWSRVRAELNYFEPWKSFHALFAFYKKNNIRALFFVMSESENAMDSRYPSKFKRLYRYFIKKIIKHGHVVGIHPGVETEISESAYSRQKTILDSCANYNTLFSRQHALKFDIAITPKIASSLGILSDFTLAYPELPGFRNGTCRGSYAYDFSERQPMSIKLYSTAIMDFTLFDGKYSNFSDAEVKNYIRNLYFFCSNYSGVFVLLLHTGYMTNRYKKYFFDILRKGSSEDGVHFDFGKS